MMYQVDSWTYCKVVVNNLFHISYDTCSFATTVEAFKSRDDTLDAHDEEAANTSSLTVYFDFEDRRYHKVLWNRFSDLKIYFGGDMNRKLSTKSFLRMTF